MVSSILSVAPCRGVHQLDQLQTVQVMGVDVVGDGPAVGGEVNGVGGGVFQEGEPQTDLLQFQLSQKIQEAADSLQFCRVFNNRLVRYEDMGALRMLATYSHRSNLEQVIPPAVTRLAEYDKLNNTQYLETLDSLLGNNLNLSKTAKQLF